jgi:hypothetical protein
MNDARASARELMQVGQQLNDPRSTGFGLALLTWIAVTSGSYAEALAYAEQSLAVAVTPIDRLVAASARACALVLLGQPGEGAALVEELRRRCVADGFFIIEPVGAMFRFDRNPSRKHWQWNPVD